MTGHRAHDEHDTRSTAEHERRALARAASAALDRARARIRPLLRHSARERRDADREPLWAAQHALDAAASSAHRGIDADAALDAARDALTEIPDVAISPIVRNGLLADVHAARRILSLATTSTA